MTEYAVLAGLWWRARRRPARRDPRPWSWPLAGQALVACALWAAADEIHQALTADPGGVRLGRALDTAGAALGRLVLWRVAPGGPGGEGAEPGPVIPRSFAWPGDEESAVRADPSVARLRMELLGVTRSLSSATGVPSVVTSERRAHRRELRLAGRRGPRPPCAAPRGRGILQAAPNEVRRPDVGQVRQVDPEDGARAPHDRALHREAGARGRHLLRALVVRLRRADRRRVQDLHQHQPHDRRPEGLRPALVRRLQGRAVHHPAELLRARAHRRVLPDPARRHRASASASRPTRAAGSS